jgi:signal transduction histidine kinase
MYTSFVVRTAAALLLAVGLLPEVAWRLSPGRILAIPTAVVGIALLVYSVADRLPALAQQTDFLSAARLDSKTFPGLTAWHWGLYLIPLALAAVAMVGAARHYPGRAFSGWLVLALAVLTGSSVHTLFWPSGFTPVVATSTLLRLAFTGIVITGGVLELRQISSERAATLAAARNYARRVTELATFKADFTAIVAHELTTPVAAIRRYADLVPLVQSPEERQHTVDAIHNELDILATLVTDVHMIADVERADFRIEPQPINASDILNAAAQYALTMPGNHPVYTSSCDVQVSADAERIAQVLRNLLNNAAKYSAPETPIEIRARRDAHRVWFEIVDRGYGIPAGELQRIFDKFERGADRRIRQTAGAGLGLYLSRKILETHGADMTVSSEPGKGSTFRFSLEVAP